MGKALAPLAIACAAAALLVILLVLRAAPTPPAPGPALEQALAPVAEEVPRPVEETTDSAAAAPEGSDGGAMDDPPNVPVAEPPELVEPAVAEPAVPLDKLLTWEQPAPASRQIDLGEGAGAGKERKPGSSGLGDRVYLKRHSDSGQPTDQERTLHQTDLGVKVPVGEDVRLRGGMRVETRQGSETPTKDSEHTPTVGVEIDF